MGEETLVNGASRINSGLDPNGNDSSEILTKGLNDAANHINREIALNSVKQKLETFQTNIVSDVQKKMEKMVEDVIQEMRVYELNASQFNGLAKQQTNRIWSNRENKDTDGKSTKRKLPEKVFIPRRSYLTNLLEVNHMRAIYHIFFVIFSVIFLNIFIHDCIVDGRLNFGIGTIRTGFGKFHIAMGLWSCMQIIALALYYVFKLWAHVRFTLRKNEPRQRAWNYFCVASFVSFQLYFGYIFAVLCVRFELPLISSTVVLLEMARFMMKMHAFVRTNAPLQGEKCKEDDCTTNVEIIGRIPSFSQYLFFLFAPTLIYRDSYPRTKHINWLFVAKNIGEVVAVIFFNSFIHERFLRPYFGQFGKEKITVGELVVMLFAMIPPGFMIFLSGFYCILHAWQNLAAELLRFADRMFYKDWWTACNYESYYRDWNIVVHDWLYEYIYKDLYMHVCRGSKSAAGSLVILISAIVHEYLIAFAVRTTYPVMLFFFGVVGLFCLRIFGRCSSQFGNFFLLWSLAVGSGLMVSFYTMEYYARQNCSVGDSWKDYFVPVSWWCNGIIDSS